MEYKDAGVNISEAEKAVKLFAPYVLETYDNVPGAKVRKFGQFTGLVQFDYAPDIALGFSMDGVGTKLMIALQMKKYDTIGECLVAHCRNDLLTAGVRAQTLLDYVATAGLDAEITSQLVIGIAKACKKFGLILLGGETAEMPGIYHEGQYDLVACIQGMVAIDKIIDGSKIKPGDMIFGMRSAGLHCNGYSLAREVFKDMDLNQNYPPLGNFTYAEELLKPSHCYADEIHNALDKGCDIHGMANITGGGIPGNLQRILPDDCRAVLDQQIIEGKVPEIMRIIQSLGGVEWPEMVKTFNMGVGFIVIVPEDESNNIIEHTGYNTFPIGRIESGDGPKVSFEGTWGSF